jgi:hypothetical protein
MPYVERPYLIDPADLPVWRYMNIEKLLSILSDQTLFFASVKTLAQSDRYEGRPTPTEMAANGLVPSVAKKLDRYNAHTIGSLFFNCWHMNDSESDAMWKIYVAGTGGVAIRSNIARLKQCFQKAQQEISLGQIEYIGDNHTSRGFYDHMVQRFMRKRLAFRHEQEVRLVYYHENRRRISFPGVSIPVDVNVLIEKIVISPRAENWFLPLVKTVLNKFGYNIDVVPSEGSRPLTI